MTKLYDIHFEVTMEELKDLENILNKESKNKNIKSIYKQIQRIKEDIKEEENDEEYWKEYWDD